MTVLIAAATAPGAGASASGPNIPGTKTFQADGTTSAGAGAATILVQGSLDNVNFDTIGTITLTLATTTSSDSFTSNDRYKYHRGNVSAISGTNASVNLRVEY